MVSISNGVDSESEKYVKDIFRLLSLNWFSRGRLIKVIIRLYAVVLIQIMLFFDSQTNGMSIIVGIIIFSIGEDLSFVHGLRRMCLRLLLVGIILGRLHKPRILVE